MLLGLGRSIAGAVGKAVGALEAGVGQISERAVVVERQRAVGRGRAELRGERVAVDVGIIRQHTAGRVDGSPVIVDVIAFGQRHRRVVDGVDGNRDRDFVRLGRAITDAIGERITTVKVGIGLVVERAIGLQ